MRKTHFIAAVGASALMLTGAMATAASAQPWGGYDRGYERNHDRGYNRGNLTTGYVDGLGWRINNAAQEGRISWGHARQLQRELREVQPLAWRVETGRASQWEYQRLAGAVNRIEAATNNYPRYGYNNRWR
ncbi:hypothetical protein LRS10_08420 [Phenylobacterium sp. J426]|uniref:hypothetical protein n=1 Tax=Phenylobacterium sp. J426 TaxID=2898439 RepID=UPI0021513F21|nr:hypothetical protein [Phenylobacterium sp. J426]MCR5874181.1 hypothetical protein [Phenylobacterium sp. J426]